MRTIFGIGLLAILLSGTATAMPAQILLLRHAEKPDQGDELSAKGWARAKALPKLFYERPEFQAYGLPVALYGMGRESPSNGSVRSMQTLQFVSTDLHLPVISDFVKGDERELVSAIRSNRELDGHLVVICWEHKMLTEIASYLHVDPLPYYPSEKFDRAWLLTMNGERTPSFQDLPELLLPGDGYE